MALRRSRMVLAPWPCLAASLGILLSPLSHTRTHTVPSDSSLETPAVGGAGPKAGPGTGVRRRATPGWSANTNSNLLLSLFGLLQTGCPPPLSPSALRPRRSFSCTHTAGPHRIRTTSCRAAAQHRARSHRACDGGKGPCQIEDRPPARQRVLRAADAAGALSCLEPPPGPLHSVCEVERWAAVGNRTPPRATALARLPCGRWQRGGVVCRLHCASSDV